QGVRIPVELDELRVERVTFELLELAKQAAAALVLRSHRLADLLPRSVRYPAEFLVRVVLGDLPDGLEELRQALKGQARLMGDGRQRDAKQAAQGALAARHEVHGEHLCLRVAAELLAGAADPECPSDRCVGSHDSSASRSAIASSIWSRQFDQLVASHAQRFSASTVDPRLRARRIRSLASHSFT